MFPIVVYIGPDSVEENKNFSITCNVTRFSYIKWRLNGTKDDVGSVETYNNTDWFVSTLTVQSARAMHTGRYKCSSEMDDCGHSLTVVLPGEKNIFLGNS